MEEKIVEKSFNLQHLPNGEVRKITIIDGVKSVEVIQQARPIAAPAEEILPENVEG